MSANAWAEVARGLQSEFEKTSSNWAPPPGDYNCILEDLDVEVREDEAKNKYLQVRPTWKILDGNHENCRFRDRYTSKNQGSLGVLRAFLEKILGEAVPELTSALTTAQSLKGSVVAVVNVVVKDGKKEGQKFVNTKVKQLLQAA